MWRIAPEAWLASVVVVTSSQTIQGNSERIDLLTRIPQAHLDRLIMASLKSDWRKTAFIIGIVLHKCDAKRIRIAPEEIYDRILFFKRLRKIESQGMLPKWRHSEIRLSPKSV